MLNFLGVAQNFSVLAETPWSSTFMFRDEVTQDVADMDGVTFEGWVMVQGAKRELRFTRSDLDGMRHMVEVTVPKLPEGRWSFEIFCAAETGEKTRLVHGYITAAGGLDSDEGETYENATLEVSLPGDATRRVQMEWRYSSAAQLAALAAQSALREMEETRKKVEKAAELLTNLGNTVEQTKGYRDEAQKIVEDAPRAYIPDISEEGYWIINGVVTDKRAVAKDGANGADAVTVVRHRITSESELPTEGATCSGGHLYYVEDGYQPASALIELPATIPTSVSFTVDGYAVAADLSTAADSSAALASLLQAVQAAGIPGVTAELADGGVSLVSENDALTVNAPGLQVTETPLYGGQISKCYAWCLDDEGNGGWVCIDADGMMTAGAGGLEVGDTSSGGDAGSGGNEGSGSSGATGNNGYIMPSGGWKEKAATTTVRGTVLMGTDDVLTGETAPVGKDAQGRMCVEVARTLGSATYDRHGVVLLGSQFDIKCSIPYLLSITADHDGRLMQNLLPGGALKHMRRKGWQDSGTQGAFSLNLVGDTAYVMGLHTSSSFFQSEQNGLELNPATTKRVGGVTLADGFNDPTPAHVLDAIALRLAVFSKTEVRKMLESYIKTNSTLVSIQVLKQEDYDALAQIDAHTLFLTY